MFLDLLGLTLLTVLLDAVVVWKIYEDALTEQRTAVADIVTSVLQGVVESLPPDVAAVPTATRARLAALMTPLESRDLGLESATVFDEVGRPFFSVGAPPPARPLSSDEDLKAALFNRMESLTLDHKPGPAPLATVLQITEPVRLQSGQRWAVRVRMPLQEGQGVFSRLQRGIVGILAVNVLILGVLGYLLVTRRLVRPIERLAAGVRGVSEGRLDLEVQVDREDEIGELSRSFNQMVGALAAYRRRSDEHLASLAAANQQLVATREQLVHSEKLASVGRLAAGVAHEVGNPLAAVIGYVEILLADASDEGSRDLLERVRREVGRIDGIVRELLDLSRAPVGEARPVDLGRLAADLVRFLAVEPRLAGVKTRVDVPEDTPRVLILEQKLRQVLINLILNAADAVGPGGSVTVRARTVRAEDVAAQCAADGGPFAPTPPPAGGAFVAVSVEDDGPGIPRELLSHVFEPFFTTKDPGQGTGLGLSVALRMVEAQAGFITVRTAAGEGTCLTVHLPVAPSDEARS